MARRGRRGKKMGFAIPRIPFYDYERDKERAHDSKDTYYTSTDAEQAALMARMRTGENNIRPYRCRYGDGNHYHIGHQYS